MCQRGRRCPEKTSSHHGAACAAIARLTVSVNAAILDVLAAGTSTDRPSWRAFSKCEITISLSPSPHGLISTTRWRQASTGSVTNKRAGVAGDVGMTGLDLHGDRHHQLSRHETACHFALRDGSVAVKWLASIHRGAGHAALAAIIKAADRHGATLELTARPERPPGEGKQMTPEELEAFYGGFGFVVTRRGSEGFAHMARAAAASR